MMEKMGGLAHVGNGSDEDQRVVGRAAGQCGDSATRAGIVGVSRAASRCPLEKRVEVVVLLEFLECHLYSAICVFGLFEHFQPDGLEGNALLLRFVVLVFFMGNPPDSGPVCSVLFDVASLR